MLKDDYIAHVFSLEVPAGDAHIEDVNAFLRVLVEAKRFNNKIRVYPQQVCYRDRKARKKLSVEMYRLALQHSTQQFARLRRLKT